MRSHGARLRVAGDKMTGLEHHIWQDALHGRYSSNFTEERAEDKAGALLETMSLRDRQDVNNPVCSTAAPPLRLRLDQRTYTDRPGLVRWGPIPDIRNDVRSVGAELFDLHFVRPCRFGVGAGRGEHRFDDEIETANEVLVRCESRLPRSTAVYLPGKALGFFQRRLWAIVVGTRCNEANCVGLRARCAQNGDLTRRGTRVGFV